MRVPFFPVPSPSRRSSLALLGLFAALALLHTWPLATNLAGLSRHDNADAILNEWTVAWVAHQLPRAPLHLFDANIFYPEPRTLVYSEHLFVPALMGAPLLWSGVPTLVVYNLLVLSGLALTGWTTTLVVRRWTGDWLAGVVAGSLMTFNTYTLTRMAHVQALHAEFLVPVLLWMDRWLRALARGEAGAARRAAVALAVTAALQALCSNYLLVMTLVAMSAGLLSRPDAWLRRRVRPFLSSTAIAATIGAVLLVPFLWPYAALRRAVGLDRPLDEVALYSARWSDYLATAARLHYATWSAPFYHRADTLFPTVTGLALSAVAMAGGSFVRNPVIRMTTAIGLVGLALSFGPAFAPYAWLYQAVPLLHGIRGAARFGYLVIVACAVLAGFGLARIRSRLNARRWPKLSAAVGVGTLLVATAETLRAPMGFTPALPVSPLYRTVARTPGAVLAEFPLFGVPDIPSNAPYMLGAVRHWAPLVNGYSGFVPPSYIALADETAGFPDASSIRSLRKRGVTLVMVHLDRYPAEDRARVKRAIWETRELEVIEMDGVRWLLRLRNHRMSP